MIVLSLAVLGLVGLGIGVHAKRNGIRFSYMERFDVAEYLEQERAERHALDLKAEKIFLANELKLMKAEARAEKYKIRRAGDSLILTVIKNALFHSKAKMERVRPHTARKLIAGRRKRDGKSGLLDFGLATCGVVFIVLVFFMPTVVIPSYQPQEVIRVVEYAQPKTTEQIAEIQKRLMWQPVITPAESKKVFKKTDNWTVSAAWSERVFKKIAKAKYDAEPTTIIDLSD